MHIGELSRRAGVRPSAIRYYEQIGLLPPSPRAGGQRQYDKATVDRLATIRFAKHVGFTLDEVRQLLNGDGKRIPERWHQFAHEKLEVLDALIKDAQALKDLVEQTLQSRCPKLAERGRALRAPDGQERRSPLVRGHF